MNPILRNRDFFGEKTISRKQSPKILNSLRRYGYRVDLFLPRYYLRLYNPGEFFRIDTICLLVSKADDLKLVRVRNHYICHKFLKKLDKGECVDGRANKNKGTLIKRRTKTC